MRRPLILLLALLLAAPAAAQEKQRGHIRVIQPSPLSRLRGPTAPEAIAAQGPGAAPLASPVPLAAMTPPPLPFAPQASEPAQCRIGCAQSYYFCLAGDDAESCAPAWGQCRAACSAPQLGLSVAGVMR